MFETKAAFGRRIGRHKSNITRATRTGRVVLTPTGMVDVEASLEKWHSSKAERCNGTEPSEYGELATLLKVIRDLANLATAKLEELKLREAQQARERCTSGGRGKAPRKVADDSIRKSPPATDGVAT
jgi:hypothetical protein